jgi:hypothetical protein
MHLLTLGLAGALAVLAAAVTFWRMPRLPRDSYLLLFAVLPLGASIVGIQIPWLFLISMVAVAIWGMRNRGIGGLPIVVVGVCLNVLVMVLHGGRMPIETSVLARLGEMVSPGTILHGSKDIAVESSPLWMLSDWITLAVRGYSFVVSPGDVLVLTGLLWWLLADRGMRKDKTHAGCSSRTACLAATRAK